MEIKELVVYEKEYPERKAVFSEFPQDMLPELKGYLENAGIPRLYCHQAEMFERAQKKENLVITTSTASGKTLGFLLPVLQEILKNPLARAIFIYPTKALAADQYRAIRSVVDYFGEDRVCAGVYDGDTPASERSRIRKNANLILTNPEMLNGAFLPNHSRYGFDFIFSNLKYVVIDELHTYRGAFGSHLANVFRRLSRICRYYRSAPQFLCSSATIANPVELASEICGQEFSRISRDGSPAGARTYRFLQPPKIKGKDGKDYGQVPSAAVASQVIVRLVEENRSFIAFAKSRRNVEVVLKEASDILEGEGCFASLANRISGYRGGYTPAERKEIENKMISGALTGLISTNALELGIDIGKVETTVLVGYSGTRASFWQQTGRAGRNGKPCCNYLILENLPFDQYVAVNPDWLFSGASENAIVDKNNLFIELAHIRAAAAELPLTLDDISVFPDLGETIPVLLKVKELNGQNGKFAWSGSAFPAGDFSLRNIDKIRYKLILKDNGREITEMDEMQAFRELHEGAVYLHDGVQYQVTQLDPETHTALAAPFQGNFYTMPVSASEIRILHSIRESEYKRTKIVFGDVNVNTVVTMYRKLQFHNHQSLGFEQLPAPLCKDIDTESTWIRIPANVARTYRRLMQIRENGKIIRNNHFEGLMYALKNAAMMVTMTEQEDIGMAMSSNAAGEQEWDPQLSGEEEIPFGGMDTLLFFYDQYAGGLGYAEKIADCMPRIIENAIMLVGGCSCETGCAACIGDYRLDKGLVLWGLKNLSEETQPPVKMYKDTKEPLPFIRSPFTLKELEQAEKWEEFCAFLQKKGDPFAAFLSTVPMVEWKDSRLILYTSHTFYRDWVLEESNYRSLQNIFRFYTDAPAGLRFDIRTQEEDSPEERMRIHEKLMRNINKK